DYIVDSCRQLTAGTDIKVETGSFGADMTCNIVNDGPFTIDLDSEEL
ncbi:MAG: D-aminoacyl-tRNA deacylase, partial [Eubacterium sp.]|nr:D-aminoacyl-tRNA deacylase [Eubacterium sp.]